MKAINIAELKNNLSMYLRKVRTGEEIIVRDRDVPVARIIPWHGEHDEELLELASQGLMVLGNGLIEENFWQMPAPRVAEEALHSAIAQEREDD
jgi:prevent-host-death family protein